MIEMEKGADLMQALVDSELQPSRGQARKTIASNAVTINGEKQSDLYATRGLSSGGCRRYGRRRDLIFHAFAIKKGVVSHSFFMFRVSAGYFQHTRQ